jgi:uncharacterized protein YndB with AHSA1/START domain
MTTPAIDITPIAQSVMVDCPVEHAFSVFTERMGSWWPLRDYSIHQDADARVVVESRAGGELYELTGSGQRGHWATVRVWEPPHRLVLAWRPNPEAPAETEIEVRFTAQEAGRTRVDLEHRGWELLGPERGAQGREGYRSGWPRVLARYVEAANF